MRLATHHHYRGGHAGILQVFEQRQAIAARHHHVTENQVERLQAGQLQGPRGIVADHRFVAGQAKSA